MIERHFSTLTNELMKRHVFISVDKCQVRLLKPTPPICMSSPRIATLARQSVRLHRLLEGAASHQIREHLLLEDKSYSLSCSRPRPVHRTDATGAQGAWWTLPFSEWSMGFWADAPARRGVHHATAAVQVHTAQMRRNAWSRTKSVTSATSWGI